MPGMQFEYDEQGGTFYYFLLSFIALVLFPATYYLWPRKSSKDDARQKHLCHCDPCKLKRQLVRASQPWKRVKIWTLKLVLVLAWIFFAYIAYKASKVELDFKEFDPYAELGIDRGADVAEIKKAYRKLSLIYHPDRDTGDSNKFMYITKAYDALTDEESRRNWEQYGNPDGPGVTQVGIALPKWIVEKQNSIWVLGLYALIFMIILPLCVGMWWYHSIKYSAQQVLINTTRMYQQFIRKWPNMIMKRVIMVLGASLEFYKRFNSEIIERPSDNVEIPELIRSMPGFNNNSKDNFSHPYCVKARALLESHFNRIALPPKTLEIDRRYILKKCPYLLNELLHQAQQVQFWAQTDPQTSWRLSLDTIDNVIKTCQMVIQGVWSHKSPFLQLPHVTEDIIRHFVTKRRNIRTLKQFSCLKEEDRRALLRSLNDDEYRDVMVVCASLPSIDVDVRCEVKGEEDQTISAGSVVTLTVQLTREHLMNSNVELLESEQTHSALDLDEDVTAAGGEQEDEEDEEGQAQGESTHAKAAPAPKWMKNKKKKGPTKKPKKKAGGTAVIKKAVGPSLTGSGEEKRELPAIENHVTTSETCSTNSKVKDVRTVDSVEEATHSTNEESEGEADDESIGESEKSGGRDDELGSSQGVVSTGPGEKEGDDDEEEWMAFLQESKKENVLETKSKETHLVHCPHFPVDKYEWWWLYLADVKKKQLIAGPILITTLMTVEQKELRFSAPARPGIYQYTVVLRSDSYLGIDQMHTVKLDVKEAKKTVTTHPQWEMTDDEEEKKDEPETETDEDTDSASVDDE